MKKRGWGGGSKCTTLGKQKRIYDRKEIETSQQQTYLQTK